MSGSSEALSATSFVAEGTGYYPDPSTLEGGFLNRKEQKLRTLQQYLAGDADYVSVAMDTKAFPYGQHLRIRELEKKYGRAIDFRVVDTGGAFDGKGRSRMDICTGDEKSSLDPAINGTLHVDIEDGAPAAAPSEGKPATSTAKPSTGGRACTNDGICNPGNDGSGLICVSHQCVPGCHSNAQCPGSKTCAKDGQCR